MLRTPSAIEGEGGAISEDEARAKGRMVQVRDQMAQLAAENGLKVAPGVANALLPTIRAQEPNRTTEGFTPSLTDVVTGQPQLKKKNNELLPTPNTMDHLPARTPEQKAANKGKGGYANVRETVVNDLLPTPVTTDHKQNDSPAAWDRHSPQMGTIVHSTDWGKFQPAIERWEQVLGRPAPAPTKPDGKDGAHRLSSKFTEWMMGLPDGWITSVGLTRNEELKACGNGVVPQQAELALRILLDGFTLSDNPETLPTLATPTTGEVTGASKSSSGGENLRTQIAMLVGIDLPTPNALNGGGRLTMLPTPTVSDTFTDNLGSTQQKPGSMHSVTLPQAVRRIGETEK